MNNDPNKNGKCDALKKLLPIIAPIFGLIFSDANELVLLLKEKPGVYFTPSLALTIFSLVLTGILLIIELLWVICKWHQDGKIRNSLLAILGLFIVVINTANLTIDSFYCSNNAN